MSTVVRCYRAGRRCIDQLFTVKQIAEKAIEKNKKVYMVFVDLEKAYDNVNRGKLWKELEEYRVQGAIQALYEGGKACVKVGQRETEMFDVQKEVRQGCTLSPWLFNVFVDKVVKEARGELVSGVKLSTRGAEVLMLADDMVLMTKSAEGLENNLVMMSEVLRR